MVKIFDAGLNNCLKVNEDGVILCDGLEKWIKQLNNTGGVLFKDIDSGKIFRIEEIKKGRNCKMNMVEHKCRWFVVSKNPFQINVVYDCTDATKDGLKPIQTFECTYCGHRQTWLPWYGKIDYHG